jgi:hypothetical protein
MPMQFGHWFSAHGKLPPTLRRLSVPTNVVPLALGRFAGQLESLVVKEPYQNDHCAYSSYDWLAGSKLKDLAVEGTQIQKMVSALARAPLLESLSLKTEYIQVLFPAFCLPVFVCV